MAKRSKVSVNGPASVESIEPIVESFTEEVILISVVAVYPSILKYTGQETGKSYMWNGAGDVQQVDQRDVPYLLAKRIGNRGCCGAVNKEGNKVFELKEAA